MARRQPRLTAPSRTMCGIITGMSCHLSNSAARTPIRTAAILTPMALLFGNLILLSNMSPSLAHKNQKENGQGHNQATEDKDEDCSCGIKVTIFVQKCNRHVVRKESQTEPKYPQKAENTEGRCCLSTAAICLRGPSQFQTRPKNRLNYMN